MARFPGRPGFINATSRTRLSFQSSMGLEDNVPSVAEKAASEIGRCCKSFQDHFGVENNEEGENEFEGFAIEDQIQSKMALECKVQELGDDKYCVDVLEEVNRTSVILQPAPVSKSVIPPDESLASFSRKVRGSIIRVRPGMREVVRRSYADLNKHGFDSSDCYDAFEMMTDSVGAVEELVEVKAEVPAKPSLVDGLSPCPSPTELSAPPTDLSNGIAHEVQSVEATVDSVPVEEPVILPSLNSHDSSCVETVEVPVETKQDQEQQQEHEHKKQEQQQEHEHKKQEHQQQQQQFEQQKQEQQQQQHEHQKQEQQLDHQKQEQQLDHQKQEQQQEHEQQTQDQHMSDCQEPEPPVQLPPAPNLVAQLQRKTFTLPERSVRSSRIIFPKKRNMEDFEFPDVVSAADEKSLKLDTVSSVGVRRVGAKCPRVALAESDCIDKPAFWSKLSEKHGLDCGERMREEISRYTERMARMAVTRKTQNSPQRVGILPSKTAQLPSNVAGETASGVSGTDANEAMEPNADKVAATIQQILRSQWEDRLPMPKPKVGRPKKVKGLTSSPTIGKRAEAEHRRMSARLRTKTILRKARLKLNKRTIMQLQPPATIRKLSEQFLADQDKVNAPFRLVKFPTVHLEHIDTVSSRVRLPTKSSSSASSSLGISNSGFTNTTGISSGATQNGGCQFNDTTFAKLTLPAAITAKPFPLINPYITISKLDTSKILNNTVRITDGPIICESQSKLSSRTTDHSTRNEYARDTMNNAPDVYSDSEHEASPDDQVERTDKSCSNGRFSVSVPYKRFRGRKLHKPLYSLRRASGPRIKHVCRRASTVLNLPTAVFPSDDQTTPAKEKVVGGFVPGILNKLKGKKIKHASNVEDQETGQQNTVKKKRRSRCRKCANCLLPDCRKCAFCLDRLKYGGNGIMKQACKFRVCLAWPARPQLERRAYRREKASASETANRLDKRGSAISVRKGASNESGRSPRSPRNAVLGDTVRRLLKKAKAVNHKNGKFKSTLYETRPALNKGGDDRNRQSLIDGNFWEDYDLDRVWDSGMPTVYSSIPALRASCFLCGSVGVEELIYCVLCCEPFHTFCLDTEDAPSDSDLDNWCCQSCQYCQVCGQRNSLLKCVKCHNTYHATCLGWNLVLGSSRKNWVCPGCVKCRSCGATVPGKSAATPSLGDHSLCCGCSKLFEKGNFCPMCKTCYKDDDDQAKMVQCADCECWIHARCANMSDEEYQVMSYLPDYSVEYTCSICCPNNEDSWLSIIKSELHSGFKRILTDVQSTTDAIFPRTKGLSPDKKTLRVCISPLQQSVIRNWSESNEMKCNETNSDKCSSVNGTSELKRLLSSSPKLQDGVLPPIWKQSSNDETKDLEWLSSMHIDISDAREGAEFVIKSKPLLSVPCDHMQVRIRRGETQDLDAIIAKTDVGSYASVVEFCEDVVSFVRSLEIDHGMNTKSIRATFNTALALVFPWFKWSEAILWGDVSKSIGLLPGASISPHADHIYARYTESIVHHAIQPSAFRPSFQLDATSNLDTTLCVDTRLCVLCGSQGDFDPEASGRLLYCGQDDWIHLNCALWSAEVFQGVGGSLQQVHAAISRGHKMKCVDCAHSGATVSCCFVGCTKNYHFVCAKRTEAVFQDDKTIFCCEHVNMATGKLVSGSDFREPRTVYIDRGSLPEKLFKKSWLCGLNPLSIFVQVGSLTIQSLGEVHQVSNYMETIIPINFCCSRLYWSAKNPRQRVVYTCRTILETCTESIVKQPVNEDRTIEHTVKAIDVVSKIDSNLFASEESVESCINESDSGNCVASEDTLEDLTFIVCDDEVDPELLTELVSAICEGGGADNVNDVTCFELDEDSANLLVEGLLSEELMIPTKENPSSPLVLNETITDTCSDRMETRSNCDDCMETRCNCDDRMETPCNCDYRTNSSALEITVPSPASFKSFAADIENHCNRKLEAIPTNMAPFVEQLQELICTLLHADQKNASSIEANSSDKGKENDAQCVNKTIIKVMDTDSSEAKKEIRNLASHCKDTEGRISNFNGGAKRCQADGCNNNNNGTRMRIFLRNNRKSTNYSRLPEILIDCPECRASINSCSGNTISSRKIFGSNIISPTMGNSNKGCLRKLQASVPAAIHVGSSSVSLTLNSLEPIPWFDCGIDCDEDCSLEEERCSRTDNCNYVPSAPPRNGFSGFSSGSSEPHVPKSVVNNVVNDKKENPVGITNQGVCISQSALVKPDAFTEIVSDVTMNDSLQSNVPFIETPPPGGGGATQNTEQVGRPNSTRDSERRTTSGRSVRGNPHRCPKCKRIYRTAESFQRHYQTCDFEVDSSTSSEEDDDLFVAPQSNSVRNEAQGTNNASCSSGITVHASGSHILDTEGQSVNAVDPPASFSGALCGSNVLDPRKRPSQSKPQANASTVVPISCGGKSGCVRHPKRILPKAPVSSKCHLQQQRRASAPSDCSRNIQRSVRFANPQGPTPVVMPVIPSFVSQHQQQHHVIQIQGRTIMIPLGQVSSQPLHQHHVQEVVQQLGPQQHAISYTDRLSYLGSIRMSSQGELSSVALNVPVAQLNMSTVDSVQTGATVYQQQQLVQPLVHLTASAAPSQEQQIASCMITPQLQDSATLHDALHQQQQQSQLHEQQHCHQEQQWNVDVLNNDDDSLQPLQMNMTSHSGQHPLTCSIASQTQLSPDLPDEESQVSQRIDSPSSSGALGTVISDDAETSRIEKREYCEAETSTDFDVCDQMLPFDQDEACNRDIPAHGSQTDCNIGTVQVEASEVITSVESTTQTIAQGDGDRAENNADDKSEFADLLRKVSQQIASLASSNGRIACAILPSRSCPATNRHNCEATVPKITKAPDQAVLHQAVQVEPYGAVAEIDQPSCSASVANSNVLSICPVPPIPSGTQSEFFRKGCGQDTAEKSSSGAHITFEITSDDGFHVRSTSIQDAWREVADRVQEARASCHLRTFSTEGLNGLKMLGVSNRAVRYVLEQLPGTEKLRKFPFLYHLKDTEDEDVENKSGCARSEAYATRRDHDMFNFLASRHRIAPQFHPAGDDEELVYKSSRRTPSLELPMAMRFRHIGRTAHHAVGAYRSRIHGRGLFCKRNIDAGEMVIEYAGEVIRSILTDKREKYYNAKGIGCYMFKIDDNEVVDATMHGNAARFINHSCEPNCYSKVISVDGKKHIVIFALRRIIRGEELTYDYKFPIEDDKIPCTCGSRKCRRYLN